MVPCLTAGPLPVLPFKLTKSPGAAASTATDDPLEKTEAKKESGKTAPDGMKGGKALDEAIGDKGPDPEMTSAQDDPLEKAEATKEKQSS